MEIQLPCKKGNFEMLKILGKGKFGEVYLARYENTNQFFAIKKVNRKQVDGHPKLKEYFNTETRLMSELDHPNLMRVHSLMSSPSSHFIVLEFCNSGSLNSKIREVGAANFIPERTCLSYLFQIVSGITEMHSRKIIHRDIKPDNILFHGDLVKIADFGLAKPIVKNQSITKVGTPLYQAPEIMCTDHGTIYTSAVDIWSIGVTFFKLVYKVTPWKAADGSRNVSRQDLMTIVWSQSGINLMFPSFPQVSNESKDLMRRMIEPEPTRRISLFQIIAHPAFSFLNADQLSPADGALTLQQKVKKILADLRGKPTGFFNALRFGTGDAGIMNNPLLISDDVNYNDLASSIRIPGFDPVKEFTDRMDHERFYLRLISTFVKTLTDYLPSIVSTTSTFWVGILWSTMLLAKKAETYSLNLYTNLQNKVNCFEIVGFDTKVKNSNEYKSELITLSTWVTSYSVALKETLRLDKYFKENINSIQKNRERLIDMHNQNIEFCKDPIKYPPEYVQKKLHNAINLTCQVYFSTRKEIGLENDLSVMKKIALLDIFATNEIEVQVQFGANGFSRELFYSSIEDQSEVRSKIQEMEMIRFQKFVK